MNENSPPVARSQEGEDSLSIALNRFTQRLTTIKINNIMICPEFFWPSDKFNPRSTVWNSLTSLELQYAVATPAGEWLFEREPRDKDDEDDEDDQHDIYSDRDACIDLYGLSPYPRGPAMEDFPERRFRSMPTPNLNEFYLAAGRAAQQMPELKVMALEANVIISSSDRAVYWFRYCRALQKASWVGTSRFRMDEKVKEAWREASRKHGLDELKIEVCLNLYR